MDKDTRNYDILIFTKIRKLLNDGWKIIRKERFFDVAHEISNMIVTDKEIIDKISKLKPKNQKVIAEGLVIDYRDGNKVVCKSKHRICGEIDNFIDSHVDKKVKIILKEE